MERGESKTGAWESWRRREGENQYGEARERGCDRVRKEEKEDGGRDRGHDTGGKITDHHDNMHNHNNNYSPFNFSVNYGVYEKER